MILQLIKNNAFIKKLYLNWVGKLWVSEKTSRIVPYLKLDDRIVDIGAGNGLLANQLQQQGYHICPVDVADLAIPDTIQTIVYDGKHLPFENQSFDTALLLTVLHHTDDPVEVLQEVARVAQRIVIIEDVYRNVVQKYLTFGMDTLVNLGHSNMTYQNRSVSEWKSIFDQLGLQLKILKEKRVLLFFRQATMVVES